ncbi:GTPase Era [Longispora albida]|uniref:GTPase Era n=1 Tax=Longispora albida TaxID=203523 RepID=UPI0003695215|nr:GTPase Era [Longispora albida]
MSARKPSGKGPEGAGNDWYPKEKKKSSWKPGPKKADGAAKKQKPTGKQTSPVVREREPSLTPKQAPKAQPSGTGVGKTSAGFRAGFACFVGRPNAGKSTLTNALVGQKIAITSNKPQTTRHVIRGVVHRPEAQLILVDTPGLHRPRTLLGERLNDLVRQTWSEVDVIGLCIPADEEIGKGDKFITSEISGLKATLIAVVTKTDLVSKERLAQQLLAVTELGVFADIVPVSAVSGEQVDVLLDVMTRHLPESPQLYPDDAVTDEPEQVLIAELIREAALEGVRDELPHSIAVVVEEIHDEGNLTRIFADLYVERDSQKAIIIGHRGSRLRDVGATSRAGIESLLGTKVFLDLHVRVAKEWQRDPKQLRRLGF